MLKQDVDQPEVQETRGHETPDLAVGDPDRVADGLAEGVDPLCVRDQATVHRERVDLPAQRTALGHEQFGEEHEHVDGDQDPGEDGNRSAQGGGSADHLLGALLGALGAVEPDRGLMHAAGTDWPIAPLADHAGALIWCQWHV